METESDYYQELSREAGFLHPHKETWCMCIGQQRQAYLRLVKAVSREALSSVRKHLVYIFYAHYKHLYKDPRGWLFIPLSLTLGVWLCYTHVANAASSTHSPRTSLTQGFLCLQSSHSVSISIELSLSLVCSGCFYTMATTHMTIRCWSESLLHVSVTHSMFSWLPAFTCYADRSSYP